MGVGLADTSVFVAAETGRPLEVATLPDRMRVSVITMGELRVGVLSAADVEERGRRLETYLAAQELDPLPVDERVVEAWARLRVLLLEADRRMPVNDSWIAATALAHDLPLFTQDRDYLAIGGLQVTRV
jgi:predicted nucleic acid-binding protein